MNTLDGGPNELEEEEAYESAEIGGGLSEPEAEPEAETKATAVMVVADDRRLSTSVLALSGEKRICCGVILLPWCGESNVPNGRQFYRPSGEVVCTFCLQPVGSALTDACLVDHLQRVHQLHVISDPSQRWYSVVPWTPEMTIDTNRDGRTTHIESYVTNYVPACCIPTDDDLGMIVKNRCSAIPKFHWCSARLEFRFG